MEQQQESYGIPYAMHTHDISSLEIVSFYARNPDEGKETPYRNMVNIRLGQGWKVLHLFSDADNEATAIMGVPRTMYCTGWDNSHKATRKHWNHKENKWFCPVEGCGS